MIAATHQESLSLRRNVPTRVNVCWMNAGPLIPPAVAIRVPTGAVTVTPWDAAAGRATGPSLTADAVGRSAGEVAFAHSDLMVCRHVLIAFPDDAGAVPAPLLVRLLWCRFTHRGTYLSGGRIEGLYDGPGDAESRS